MVSKQRFIWRKAAWLCLTLFLAACMPDAQRAEQLSYVTPPTQTSTVQPAELSAPPKKADITPSPSGLNDWVSNGEVMDLSQLALEDLPAAVQAAINKLSESLQISTDQIEVVAARHVEWRDECLGISSRGSMCAQVITPGWVVVLQAEDREYTFHTDETGNRVRQK
jgi:hypothetical protein